MPELPEVEIVSRHLARLVTGRRITAARLLRGRLSPFSSPEKFASDITDGSIDKIGRRGKHILFGLSNGNTLIVHLRMSGRFILQAAEHDAPKFSHAQFDLDDGQVLHFTDQRHFGMMKVAGTDVLLESKELASLAPEPFDPAFSPEYLYGSLRSTKRTIKETLLDQTKVCGLGNIYASEALFLSQIDPRIPANRISKMRTSRLHSAIQDVLTEALSAGDTVPVLPENVGGNFYGNDATGEWRVYGREGEPCVNCARAVVRLVQGGRSTFFCRACQHR